jgi:hypothetical protein
MAEWARTPFAPRLSERARSRLARLGAPAVTAPDARQLLAQAEAAAERGLHVARGLLWVALSVVYLGPIGVKIPALLVVLAILALAAIWVWLWRLISRPPLPPWTKYVLIVADAWVIVRGVVTRPIVPQWFGPTFDADLLAVTPPLLVYLALSGALRLT